MAAKLPLQGGLIYVPPCGINGHSRNPWADEISVVQYAYSLAHALPDGPDPASQEVPEQLRAFQPSPDRPVVQPRLQAAPGLLETYSSNTMTRQGTSLRNETNASDLSPARRCIASNPSSLPQQSVQTYEGTDYGNTNSYQQYNPPTVLPHGHGTPSISLQQERLTWNQAPYGQGNMNQDIMQKPNHIAQGLHGPGSTLRGNPYQRTTMIGQDQQQSCPDQPSSTSFNNDPGQQSQQSNRLSPATQPYSTYNQSTMESNPRHSRDKPFQLSLPDERKRKSDLDSQSGPNKRATSAQHSFQTSISKTFMTSTRASPGAKLIPNSAVHMNPYNPGHGSPPSTIRPEDTSGVAVRHTLSAQASTTTNPAGQQIPDMVRSLRVKDGSTFTFSNESLNHVRAMHDGDFQHVEEDWTKEGLAVAIAEAPSFVLASQSFDFPDVPDSDFDWDKLFADLEPLNPAPVSQ